MVLPMPGDPFMGRTLVASIYMDARPAAFGWVVLQHSCREVDGEAFPRRDGVAIKVHGC